MRRAAPTAGLSPQLIKHFAIATVSITAMLALFASGEDWGVQSRLEAVEAKNRLAAAEAEKLGARKIIPKLKIRRGTGSMAMGDDSMGSGGGGGSFYPEAPSDYAGVSRSGEAGQTEFGRAAAGPQDDRSTKGRKPGTKRKPTEEELETMLEASRQRSGGSGSDD